MSLRGSALATAAISVYKLVEGLFINLSSITSMNKYFMILTAVVIFSCKGEVKEEKSMPDDVNDFLVQQEFYDGESLSYEIIKGKINSNKPGSEYNRSTTQVNIYFNTIDSNKTECIWKYGETLSKYLYKGHVDYQELGESDLFKDTEIKYIINSNGEIQNFLNFQECVSEFESTCKEYYQSLPVADSIDKEVNIEKAMNFLKPTFSNPEIFFGCYFPEVFIFSSLAGTNLNIDSVYISETLLPNPFGGNFIPATDSIYVNEISGGIAEIIYIQSFNSDSLISYITAFVTESLNKNEGDIKGEKPGRIYAKNIMRYKYDYENRIMREVYAEKIIQTDQTKQIILWKMILIE